MANESTYLGAGGVKNDSPAALATLVVDRMQGWQSVRCVTANESALSDLSAPPADAVELPSDGSSIQIRALSATNGSVICELYMFPYKGPNASVDGVGAGWREAVTLVTATAETAKGIQGSPGSAIYCSPCIYRSKLGAWKFAVRVTSASGNPTELVYRVV